MDLFSHVPSCECERGIMTPEKGNVILQHLQTSRKILQISAQSTRPLKMELSILSGGKNEKREGVKGRQELCRSDFNFHMIISLS